MSDFLLTGGELEVRCLDCDSTYSREAKSIAGEFEAETPLSRVRLACTSCNSSATMTMPVAMDLNSLPVQMVSREDLKAEPEETGKAGSEAVAEAGMTPAEKDVSGAGKGAASKAKKSTPRGKTKSK